jgi:hypothetical protein
MFSHPASSKLRNFSGSRIMDDIRPVYRKRYPQWNPVAGILSNGGETG